MPDLGEKRPDGARKQKPGPATRPQNADAFDTWALEPPMVATFSRGSGNAATLVEGPLRAPLDVVGNGTPRPVLETKLTRASLQPINMRNARPAEGPRALAGG